ncbi:DUF5988 family protein [Amycolatopsis sp. CA-230715]|uniref:DUF5988 family protein n=1 Tax=Amycolatopsis sp. CA-230715 TaxID=2745196 RepID=UPI001C00E587|nr:DUF5988 family protein [Amycolatopsis sp. CA-230715]QWF83431.1 hypothetical protein HUW46_06872 [Amycolatopsis sp. CA-230715]
MSTNVPNAVLHGGPDHFMPGASRVRHVADLDEQVKVESGGCYEHFKPTAEQVDHEGTVLRVFSWTHRTYVAE